MVKARSISPTSTPPTIRKSPSSLDVVHTAQSLRGHACASIASGQAIAGRVYSRLTAWAASTEFTNEPVQLDSRDHHGHLYCRLCLDTDRKFSCGIAR